jgi:NRPS condensation-like uncharacterized protein
VSLPDETKWTKLDNASKIFPSTYTEKDTKVFRFACELNEPVDPEALQKAVDATVDRFPLYQSVLRHGIFWFYLESSRLKPVVAEESLPVCAPIYLGHKRNLLFRVSYYKHRINLEVFHVLSDGTGALWFMQTLVRQYLSLKSQDVCPDSPSQPGNPSISETMDDSFEKHYSGTGAFGRKKSRGNAEPKNRAYRVRGTRLPENRTALIEGAMSAKAVLALAHQYDTTLTVFLSALLICSICSEMPARRKKHPVVLSVPVNLRQFFTSSTARNFFSTMNVKYDFSSGTPDLETVIGALGRHFQNELTEEQMAEKLDRFMRLARNPFIRIMPLQLKNLLLRIGSARANRRFTSAISNVGRVSMPPEYECAIRQLSVCVGGNCPKITLCTFRDRLVVSLTSPFRETNIQRAFFRQLSDMGVDVEIASII